MKLAIISDTHGRPFEIPECDVFIHCGDITAGGSLEETEQFMKWLRRQTQVGLSLIVPGNHDRCFQEEWLAVEDMFASEDVLVMIDQAIKLGDRTFYGSPWTPPFMNWFFMADEERLGMLYRAMPKEVDVLITHGPPRGILDTGYQDPHVGSIALAEAIEWRNIKHNVFGHLHSCGGQTVQPYVDGTIYHNVAACDDAYNMVRKCKVLEI